MWKMFITVLALNTQTGTPSTAITVTDYPTAESCFIAAGQIGKPQGEGQWAITSQKDGISVTMKVHCMPVEGRALPVRGQVPPPIAGMIEGFFSGLRGE